VLFLDDLEALRAARGRPGVEPVPTAVEELLTEMDSTRPGDDGVFIVAATARPWHVDPALLAPGSFDRWLLVPPPDAPAREALLDAHLRKRPINGVDARVLVPRTEHFSALDLARLCGRAAELAFEDFVRSGRLRMLSADQFERAMMDVRPSTDAWVADARTAVRLPHDRERFGDLIAYLRELGVM
jgi:SpoVK/Ycf46/Vps4 family AAA+-type ATPase